MIRRMVELSSTSKRRRDPAWPRSAPAFRSVTRLALSSQSHIRYHDKVKARYCPGTFAGRPARGRAVPGTALSRGRSHRRPHGRRTAGVGADVVVGPVESDRRSSRVRVEPFGHERAEHAHEPGMRADRGASHHLETQHLAEIVCLHVEVVHDLQVIRQEPDRVNQNDLNTPTLKSFR